MAEDKKGTPATIKVTPFVISSIKKKGDEGDDDEEDETEK